MKQTILFLFIGSILTGGLYAQQLTLKKGVIIDSIRVHDSIPESFALYLPTNFENTGKWPVIFVFDMEGRGKQALGMFREASEKQGYILAASNNSNDSLSISQNIRIANRMFKKVYSLFSIHKSRTYTAGFSSGAKLASIVPTFIKHIEGVISCGSAIPNTELLNSRNPFHFLGIVGKEDFNYTEMLNVRKILNKMKFPNHLLVFDRGHEWPNPDYLEKAMEVLTLASMVKGDIPKDEAFVKEIFKRNLDEINGLIASKKLIRAHDLLGENISVYRMHMNVDSLKERKKMIKKDRLYRTLKRNENNIFFRESFIKDEYRFNLWEDLSALNYNNLGWWNYQMGEIKKYEKKASLAERQMGKRLLGYLNALVEDNIDIEKAEYLVNEEAVSFLYMLKTITDPKDYTSYLKIISDSANYEDYGTALFYLEELLKNGYKDKAELYALEHTALLRITPEFNKIVDKYLKDARYDIIEE